MGLLDGALENALGSLTGNNNAGAGTLQGMLGGLVGQLGGGNSHNLLATAMNLLQQHGGLEGIVEKFRANGLGHVVDSWVGAGPNQAVSGPQLQQVLGHSSLGEMATQLGTTPELASGSLASVLPELVNSLTPNGQIPSNGNDLLSEGLTFLKGKLGTP